VLNEKGADPMGSEKKTFRISVSYEKNEFLCRFLAEDPDSGRRDTFLSRSTQLDVTELTLRSLRTADPRVASLAGNLVRAHAVGRTEVQVRLFKKLLVGFVRHKK
jgi:hypothetical protein